MVKVGLIMKSSGGKKAQDGAELVRMVEDWQVRLFTLGKDIEGVPMVSWYKDMEQYKVRATQSAPSPFRRTGFCEFHGCDMQMRKKPQKTLTLERARAELGRCMLPLRVLGGVSIL
eukprot:SAG31_NODE_1677_length_7533_cov_2.288054_9_plen_116_part_00